MSLECSLLSGLNTGQLGVKGFVDDPMVSVILNMISDRNWGVCFVGGGGRAEGEGRDCIHFLPTAAIPWRSPWDWLPEREGIEIE